MLFVHDPTIVLKEHEREIIQSLNHPLIEESLTIPELKSLEPIRWKDGFEYVEDIRLICVHKSLANPSKYPKPLKDKEIISIDIKESLSNESSASASIDRDTILKQCPDDQYHQIWYHTHNNTISVQSIEDQVSGQDLMKSGIGKTMCAAGVLGVTCHIQDGDDPVIASSPWSKIFWKELPKYDFKPNIQLKHPKTKSNVKTANFDQILCYYNNPKRGEKTFYECTGKNLEHSVEDMPIGRFTSVAIGGESDQYIDGLGDGRLFKPNDGKFTCFVAGDKLICQ